MRAVILLLVFMPFAATADDLDDSYAICMKHKHDAVGLVSQQKPWDDGWGHCADIVNARDQRNRSAEDRDPELKKTLDTLRKLKR